MVIPKIDSRGSDEHDQDGQHHRRRADQHLTHPHILAYRVVVPVRDRVCPRRLVCIVPALNTRVHAIVK
jgi:hypothetical protein